MSAAGNEPHASTVFEVDGRFIDAWGREMTPDDEEDGNTGYDSWTAKQLIEEITRRNADRDDDNKIVFEGKKKSDAVAALEADDEAAEE